MALAQPFSVLVVDDEPLMRKTVRVSLTANGFAVEEAGTGGEALGAVHRRPFDLVLLDVNMPGMTGVEACKQIRTFAPRIGIIMVTVRDEEEDKVQALDAGADDYVTKPFRVRELIARLNAVLRRSRTATSEEPGVLVAGDLRLDLERRILRKAGQQVHLSPKEFDLVTFLMRNQGVPLTHANILREVWGAEFNTQLEYLRTYVRMVRKKIESDPGRPEYLLTEPWVGYRFCNPADPDSAANLTIEDE
ncbi:MAG TPA: response regulator transcription factor [Bryobacteraceae bacterium]|nr:response regulator transcription factor [Bryobacteraceae bacterium]